MIPSDEAKLFLHKVQVYDQNELRHCDTRIPSISKFNYLFDNPKLPRPRYLGQIRSKSSFDILDSGLLTGTEPLNIKATTDEAKFIKNAGDDAKLQSELDAFQKVIETICVTSVEGYSEVSRT